MGCDIRTWKRYHGPPSRLYGAQKIGRERRALPFLRGKKPDAPVLFDDPHLLGASVVGSPVFLFEAMPTQLQKRMGSFVAALFTRRRGTPVFPVRP
jgi:hypothetical protein